MGETYTYGRPFVPVRSCEAFTSSTRVTGSQLCWLVLLMIVTSVSSFFGQTLRSATRRSGTISGASKKGHRKVCSLWHRRATDFCGLEPPPDCFASTAPDSSYFTRPSVISSFRRMSTPYLLRRRAACGSDMRLAGSAFLKMERSRTTAARPHLQPGVSGTSPGQGRDRMGCSNHGFWRFDHSHWQHIGPATSLPPGALLDVRFDREGTLWAMTGT